jgi:hypothetical protein
MSALGRAKLEATILVVFALLSGLATARTQTPASPSPQLIPRNAEQQDEAYREAHRISLIVQVTDTSGRQIAGLTSSDFTVLDQKKPQTLVRFREVDGRIFSADVHVIVVLDAINDSSSVDHARKMLLRWLTQSKGLLMYPMSLAHATAAGVSQIQASRDPLAIIAELTAITWNLHRDADCDQRESTLTGGNRRANEDALYSSRVNCMADQFHRSIDAFRSLIGNQQQVRGRTILIWTGPGWSWPVEYQANYRDARANVTTSMREAQVTLAALSWSEFGHGREIRQPIMSVTASLPSTPDEAECLGCQLPVADNPITTNQVEVLMRCRTSAG